MDADTVRKVAKLAHIDIDDTRVAVLTEELSGIFNWIEQLNEVDIDGTEVMYSAVDIRLPLREDIVTENEVGGNRAADIIANAPKADDNFFVVPKVVE